MNLIDLTQTLGPQTPIFPGDTPPVFEGYKTIEKDGYLAYRIISGFHIATHIDMPSHFCDDPRMAADFSVECFAGRGVLLDVRGEDIITMKPQYEELVKPGTIVLLHTGFDEYFYGNPQKYYTEYPTVDIEFAQFLVDRQIKILGMDCASPDHAPYDVHKLMLPAGIFMLENLTNLGALQNLDAFEVFALPLKVAAEGSFVRVVARPVKE